MSSALGDSAYYESTLIGGIHRQFTTPKALPADINLEGQTAIITGSNGSLGLEACRQLLGHGLSHLIMAVRSKAKGEAAAEYLRQEFPNPSITISVYILQMESYESIRQFVDQCATLSRIDIVLLNAAAVKYTYTQNPTTNHETTLQVNYLSTAFLTILLLPVLKSMNQKNKPSRPPVLSLVGSDTMYSPDYAPQTKGPVLPQFDNQEKYDFFARYASSKILLMLFVSRLAESVDPADILINVSNPGFTRSSSLDKNVPVIHRLFFGLARLILGRSVKASASIYLDATLTRGPESHGSFVSDWAIKPYPKFSYTTEGQDVRARLWEETLEEFNFAGASKIVQSMLSS